MAFNVERVRLQFPALSRTVRGRPAAYFDGPAGTQVPQRVVDAVSLYFLRSNANHGGRFATSVESDAVLDAARAAVADLVGSPDPDCIVFGANMTTLTFHASRALARTWRPGDEVLVTDADHDANVSPWRLAAQSAGARVRSVRIRPEDASLDLDDLESKLSERTRLVAAAAASNLTGTLHPIERIVAAARRVGAIVYLDAVHYAPHGLMDAARWDADFVVASAYKFFGPHVGVLYGKREHLETLPVDKVRPAPDRPPNRWMTGTQNHEGIAGVLAAVEYLASLLVEPGAVVHARDRRRALEASWSAIVEYERSLAERLLLGLREKPDYRVWGVSDPARLAERVPTFAITSERETPARLAQRLADEGIFAWSGNCYALPLTTALGLEPDGVVRVGLVHYNTVEEVDRLLAAL
jgi:cysteine desulfurase family protein (TIGR01976 family)